MKKRYGNWMQLVFMTGLVLILQVPGMAAEPLPADLDQLGILEIAQLVEDNYKAPENTQEAADIRAELKDHIWSKYFSNSGYSATGEQGMRHIKMGWRMMNSLSAGEQATLKNIIKTQYIDNRSNLASLRGDGWYRLSQFQQAAGSSPSQIAEISAAWATTTSQLQSLKMAELGHILDLLEEGHSSAVDNARSQLASHAWTYYLNNAGLELASADRKKLTSLARHAAPMLTSDQTTLLVDNLYQRLIINAGAEPLTPEQWEHLDFAFVAFGADQAVRSDAAVTWATANPNWRQLSATGMGQLIQNISKAGSPTSDSLKAAVAAEVLSAYLTNDTYVSSARNITRVLECAYFALPVLEASQQQPVIDLLKQKLIDDPQVIASLNGYQYQLLDIIFTGNTNLPDNITGIAEAWVRSGTQWDNAKPAVWAHIIRALEREQSDYRETFYPVFQAQLAEQLADTDTDWTGVEKVWYWPVRHMAHAIDTSSDLSAFYGPLTQGDEPVRTITAVLLAWAHRFDRNLTDWQGVLDQKIADSSIAGDEKAAWLMARAYAEDEAVIVEAINSLAGKRWADQSKLASQSDSARLAYARWYINGSILLERFDQANDEIERISTITNSVATQRYLDNLRDNYQDEYETQQRQEKENRVTAWRQHLQGRLDEARAKGDQVRIKRYERLLGIGQ